jgi:pimeloyl-ACP methyl ester carboxylesterase
MRLWKKIFKKKRFYFILTSLILTFYCYDFLELRVSNDSFIRLLNNNPFNYQASINYFEENGRKLRYLEIGNDSLPLIVFIHGAPSSSSFWKTFLVDSSLLTKAKLMAVDRPGYGYSGYGRPETSVEKQAAYIAKILEQKREQHPSIVIHGSSYGGTVAARLAMDFPDLVDGLLLQSASVMPGEEKTYLFSYITEHWLLSWMLPGSLHVANSEKLSHKSQLEAMSDFWHRIKSASIVLHGTDDDLIYPENAHYAKEKLTNASFLEVQLLNGRKHDLLWTKRDLLLKSLEKLLHLSKDRLYFSDETH